MKKFLAVVTSMAMALSLLTACGSNAVSTETTAATASEATSEKEATEKEAEEPESVAETAGVDSTQFQSSILFCGSTSLYPTLSSLASSFTEKYVTWDAADSSFPDFNISVYAAPGGSGVRVSAVIDGMADFGILTRDIKDSETEALGEHYQEFVVAKGAFTVSVNVENPICDIMDDMPAEAIRQIFAGEIATWDQVDPTLPAETINVYIRDLSSGAYEVLQKNATDDSEVIASATQSMSMTGLAINIVGDERGTGYAGSGTYNKANVGGQALTVMKVDEAEAMAENITGGAYTIQRPVMSIAGVEITPPEQAFTGYIFSQTGCDAVEANRRIPASTPEA